MAAIVESNQTEVPVDEQTKLWNGTSGRAWIDLQQLLDQMFRPLEDMLVEAVSAASATRVLDVGCGTGSTTLAVARVLGAQGSCVGLDLSAPMIAVARDHAERERTPAGFVVANAQDHAFERADFDMFISRFGIMFFEDSVRAFANLRRAARDDAVMRFIAWRSAAENPFMTTAERAAAPFLPNLPPRTPNAPGQFAFADRRRVQSILEESGWMDIDIRPIDVPCSLPAKDLSRYVTRLGPVGMILQEADDRTRAQVTEAVGAAFEPYVHGEDVRFTAACWMIASTSR
jgi:SAM-dependent methyltransferase